MLEYQKLCKGMNLWQMKDIWSLKAYVHDFNIQMTATPKVDKVANNAFSKVGCKSGWSMFCQRSQVFSRNGDWMLDSGYVAKGGSLKPRPDILYFRAQINKKNASCLVDKGVSHCGPSTCGLQRASLMRQMGGRCMWPYNTKHWNLWRFYIMWND